MGDTVGCCRGVKRSMDFWEYERQASGETPIPGTNATVEQVQTTYHNMVSGLDTITDNITFNSPALINALDNTLSQFEAGV